MSYFFYGETGEHGMFYRKGINPVIPEGAVELTDEEHHELMVGVQSLKEIIANPDGWPILVDPAVVWQTGQQLADKVDATIAEIYARWARFEKEYQLRERAALAYKAAGYTGDVSVWISAFAEATNLSARAACDQILSQSAALRVAQEDLGALRMRKYEILPLSEQTALDKYNEINAQIQQAVALIE